MPKQESNLHSKIDELEKKQNDMAKEIEEKYGKISINLESGEYEIIPEKE